MHEQDVRRAVGRPGGMDTAPARHTAEYLAESLGFVLGKKVGRAGRHQPGAGHGRAARRSRSTIDENGRGERLPEPPADPTVTLRMDRESFIRLAGGRCAAEPGAVTVERRPGARRAGRSPTSPPPRDVTAAGPTPGSSPTSPTRPGAPSWSPARRWAGSATTPRSSWPAGAAGWCWPAAARSGSPRPARPSATRSRRRARAARGRPRRPGVGAPRGRGSAAAYGPIDVLVNNAGVMGTLAPGHRRRPRPAAGDQPLRAVPAHRAAAAAAGRQRGRHRGHGLVEHAPHRAGRPARRPARAPRPLRQVARLRRSPSSPTCCSPTSSTAGPGAGAAGARRWPRTPGSPAPTWRPTASTAAPPAASPRSSTPAIKAVSQSAAPGAWPMLMAATADLPGATYVGPGGLGELSGCAPGRHVDAGSRERPGRAAAALGAQRGDDGHPLPLSLRPRQAD